MGGKEDDDDDDDDDEPRVETSCQWLSDGAIREMFWDIDRLDRV